MKNYKLKIKDDKVEWNDYGLGIEHSEWGGYVWLEKFPLHCLSYHRKEYGASKFTEEDINKLPYGFVRQHELIEVEEELYNIVCPYTDSILRRSRDDSTIAWDNSKYVNDTTSYQRCFTLREIEDKYPNMIKMARKYKK